MITIDDGPDPESTYLWMDLLEKHQLKGLFFFRGDHALKYPSLVQEVRSRGHMIGSHGFHHFNGWKVSTEDYMKDVRRSLDLLETNLFRPPFGKLLWSQYNQVIQHAQLVMWSVMPGDFDSKVTSADVIKRMECLEREDIIVVHDRRACFDKMHQIWSQPSFVDKIQKFI